MKEKSEEQHKTLEYRYCYDYYECFYGIDMNIFRIPSPYEANWHLKRTVRSLMVSLFLGLNDGKRNAKKEPIKWLEKMAKGSFSFIFSMCRVEASFLPVEPRTSVKVQVIWMSFFTRELHKEICKLLFIFRMKHNVLCLGRNAMNKTETEEKILIAFYYSWSDTVVDLPPSSLPSPKRKSEWMENNRKCWYKKTHRAGS